MAAYVKLLLLSAHHFHSLYTRLAFSCSCPSELPSHSCHLASCDSSSSAEAPQNSQPFPNDKSLPKCRENIQGTPDSSQKEEDVLYAVAEP